MIRKIVLFFLFSCVITVELVCADTIYLKNGRRVEGMIKSETEEKVELNIGFGVVGFNKREIERIERSNAAESREIADKWEKQKQESLKKNEEAKLKEELAPKHSEMVEENGQLIVDTLLNRKVHAELILDTGASSVMLSKKLAEKLGIDLSEPVSKKDSVQVTVADGRKVNARRYILDYVSVKDAEADNVEAVIMLEDIPDGRLKDGLLGMSFLSRFSFHIDARAKKLILERLR